MVIRDNIGVSVWIVHTLNNWGQKGKRRLRDVMYSVFLVT